MQEIDFELSGGEFIELYKLLKAIGLCETGGAAKMLVSEGEVRVDGTVELRKGCKIRPGQLVELEDVKIKIHAAAV